MSTASPATQELEAVGWTRRLASAPWPELAAPIGLVVLVVAFGLLDSTFVSVGNIEAMLQASSILVVLAVGQTFVVATAGIDLSMASVMTLGAVVLGLTFQATDNIALAMVAGVLAAMAVGAVNGTIIAKGGITDFIVTLGTLSAASGLALILADGRPINVLDRFMLKLASGGIGPFSWSVIVAAVVAVLAHVALFNSRFGLHVLATGGSVESARAVGVRTARVKIAVYTLSGLLAGVAKALAFQRRGSTGDEDILGAYFASKYLKPVGSIGVIAAVISTAFGLTLDYIKNGEVVSLVNTLMYTCIYIFITAESLNNLYRKFKLTMLVIVSRRQNEVGQMMREVMPYRTYTVQQGVGGHSGESFSMLRTIVTHEELPAMMEAVEAADPNAFFYHHDIEGISRRYYIPPIR